MVAILSSYKHPFLQWSSSTPCHRIASNTAYICTESIAFRNRRTPYTRVSYSHLFPFLESRASEMRVAMTVCKQYINTTWIGSFLDPVYPIFMYQNDCCLFRFYR